MEVGMKEFAAVLHLFTHTGFFIFSFLFARALRIRCPSCGKRVHGSDAQGKQGISGIAKLTCPYCGYTFEPRGKAVPGKPH